MSGHPQHPLDPPLLDSPVYMIAVLGKRRTVTRINSRTIRQSNNLDTVNAASLESLDDKSPINVERSILSRSTPDRRRSSSAVDAAPGIIAHGG